MACSHDGLLLQLNLANAFTCSHHVLVLDAHDTAAPGAPELLVLVVLHVERLGERLEVLEVFAAHLGEGEASRSLLVDEFAEVGLSADEAVWHTTLAAESR